PQVVHQSGRVRRLAQRDLAQGGPRRHYRATQLGAAGAELSTPAIASGQAKTEHDPSQGALRPSDASLIFSGGIDARALQYLLRWSAVGARRTRTSCLSFSVHAASTRRSCATSMVFCVASSLVSSCGCQTRTTYARHGSSVK